MRAVQVVMIVTIYGTFHFIRFAVTRLTGCRRSIPFQFGEALASVAERLGGAFLKAGQILSTRVDLLPEEMLVPLRQLQDRVRPLTDRVVARRLKSITTVSIDPLPLASASIAQVHAGTHLASGRRVAVKLRRPDIVRKLAADVSYMLLGTGLLRYLPVFRKYPLPEATAQICDALSQQSDFSRERDMQRRFRDLFQGNPRITIPQLLEEPQLDDVIVMELITGAVPFDELPSGEPAIDAITTALRALYKMIFQAGLIHCDFHGGNLLARSDGSVILLDFGFVAELPDLARRQFSEFFLCIAFRDGANAARIVKETALRCRENLDTAALVRDMQGLVERMANRTAGQFQVAGFVYELFQIQKRHGIYGSPHFTLPILALLTFEGMIKAHHQEINFQQEAVPFVLAAMAVDTA